MLKTICDKCKDEIGGKNHDEFAAIVHSPPIGARRPHITVKYHICLKCWDALKNWINLK